MGLVDNIYKSILSLIFNSCIVNISDRIKNGICLIATHCLAAIYIFLRMDAGIKEKMHIGSFDIACLIFLMLVLLVIFGMKHSIELKEHGSWNKKLYFCFAITVFISLIVSNPSWEIKISLVMMIFVFPAFYYISANSDDYAELIKKIAISFVNIGVILHIVNILFYPYYEESIAYKAGFANPNTLAMALVPTFLCSIYLFSIAKRLRWLYLVVAGYTIGVIMLCEARTSIAICIISIICWAIYYFVHSENFRIKHVNSLITIILVICMLTVGVVATDKINTTNYEKKALNNNVNIEKEIDEKSSLEKVITKSEIRAGNDLDSFLSGRVELWKYYAKDITAFGHDYNAAREQRNMDNITLGTHSTLISYLYICGLVPAIIMLLMQICVAIYIVRRIICRYKKEEIENQHSLPQLDLFIILIAPTYCLAGLVEELIWVSRWAIATLFFISLAPIFYRRKWKRG